MRALRVVGLHEDGKSIVCEDPASRDRFLLPADEKLRAAARGDITRFGQIELELAESIRPREIQARIRSGESVAQVAESTGLPVPRVERYAYPVLLERFRIAEMAQLAHPIGAEGPELRTLADVVTYAFGVRGHDYSQAKWDSWRADENKWIICLQWKAGRSDNYAHWSFVPSARDRTVEALDELAESLLDPNSERTPRTLRAIVNHDGEQHEKPEQPTLDEIRQERKASANRALVEQTLQFPRIPANDEPANVSAKEIPTKNGHPVVPTWEDVLLGVRSERGG